MLSALVSGIVTTTNNGIYPSVASYTCNDGYALTPAYPSTRACVAHGESVAWEGTPPTCVAVSCPALSAPLHGSVAVSNGGAFPSTATYACSPGYALSPASPATRTCLATGTTTSWEAQPPACNGTYAPKCKTSYVLDSH